MFYKNLNCPYCGGTLPPPIGKRRIQCLFCNKSLFFKSQDYIPRFTFEENKNLSIKKDTEKLFSSPKISPFVKNEAFLISRRKKYIPYYIISGKRGGVMEIGKERIVSANLFEIKLDSQDNLSTQYLKNKPKIVVEEDSRVVLGDFKYIYEASTFLEFEMAQEHIRNSIRTNLNKIKAVTSSDLQKDGEVLSPNIPNKIILENGVKSAKGGKDTLEIFEVQLSIVYYPVEEVIFRFRDSFFSLTYDLVQGGFIMGLLPCKRNLLVFSALILSSFLGFFFGQFLTFLVIPFSFKDIQSNFSFLLYFGTFVFLLFSLIFGGGLNIAYLLLKTPFAAKITPLGIYFTKIADPPKSFLSPYLKFVLNTFAKGFEEALKGKRQ